MFNEPSHENFLYDQSVQKKKDMGYIMIPNLKNSTSAYTTAQIHNSRKNSNEQITVINEELTGSA